MILHPITKTKQNNIHKKSEVSVNGCTEKDAEIV